MPNLEAVPEELVDAVQETEEDDPRLSLPEGGEAVSYTHLTLPTIYSV